MKIILPKDIMYTPGNQRMSLFDLFGDSFSVGEDNLNKSQRKIIEKQNDLVYRYCLDILGINPYAISRDKDSHIIIVEIDTKSLTEDKNLYCYTLGVNEETKELVPYCVGHVLFTKTKEYDFSFETPEVLDPAEFEKLKNNNLFIKTIGIHPAYNNLGIGRLALQTLENYALTSNLETMSLKEQKCFVPLNSSNRGVIRETGNTPKLNINQKYFDKNLYFYMQNGFVEFMPEPNSLCYCYELRSRPLKKYDLQTLGMDYGFSKPLVKQDKRKPIFSIDREKTYHSFRDWSYQKRMILNDYTYSELFYLYFNKNTSEQVSPIVIKPDELSLSVLYTLLEGLESQEIHSPSYEERIAYYKNTESKLVSNNTYSTYCQTPEFVKLVEQVYKNLGASIPILNDHTQFQNYLESLPDYRTIKRDDTSRQPS